MNSARPLHLPSLVQFGLSLLAALSLMFGGGMLFLLGIVQVAVAGVADAQVIQSFMLGASLLLGGGLLLPSAWYAWHRMRSARPEEAPPIPRKIPWLLTLLLGAGWLLALLAGYWINRNGSLSWLFLPGLNLLVIGLPILWLVIIGKRGLNGGSSQRQWGIFASGLVLGPLLALGSELLVLAVIIGLAAIVIALDPALLREYSFLITRLIHTPPDPETWLSILSPYFLRPAVIAGVFGYAAVLVPLIEEAFKPVGLWLLAGRRLTAAEGFVGGLLSGAGFALFENLVSTSAGGETWVLMASMRITTAVLHMLASGLVGWGLASAWSHKRYMRLALAYLLAVTLHGIWNALGIGVYAIPYLDQPPSFGLDLETLNAVIVGGLAMLAGFTFLFYLNINRGLQRPVTASATIPSTEELPGLPADTDPDSEITPPPD